MRDVLVPMPVLSVRDRTTIRPCAYDRSVVRRGFGEHCAEVALKGVAGFPRVFRHTSDGPHIALQLADVLWR